MGQFKKRVILSETWRSHVKSKNPFSFYGNADPSTSLGMTGAPVFFLGFGQQKAPAEAGAFVGYFAEHSIIQRFAAAGGKIREPNCPFLASGHNGGNAACSREKCAQP